MSASVPLMEQQPPSSPAAPQYRVITRTLPHWVGQRRFKLALPAGTMLLAVVDLMGTGQLLARVPVPAPGEPPAALVAFSFGYAVAYLDGSTSGDALPDDALYVGAFSGNTGNDLVVVFELPREGDTLPAAKDETPLVVVT